MEERLLAGTVENHRGREKGVLVYPVYSRRSEGLSVGINLFPDKKKCLFSCPYCEVFPFTANAHFSLDQMEHDLRRTVNEALQQNINVKDLCFSGNGEPSLSPHLAEALEMADKIRNAIIPSAELVLISNGTGLLQPDIFSLLRRAVNNFGLSIWLKLDAGTPEWYEKMNRCAIPYVKIVKGIKEFTADAPASIQTMICAVDGKAPPPDEAYTWEQLIAELVFDAKVGEGGIRSIQIYGKARSSPEDPKTSALPAAFLEERAASLRRALLHLTPDPSFVKVYY